MANSFLFISENDEWLKEQTLKEIYKEARSATLFGEDDKKYGQADWESFTKNPDTLLVEEKKSIGIEEVRAITTMLSRKPFQETFAAVVVRQADLLTIPAQNAFLKPIEEPPEYAKIILWAHNADYLLPTLLSRCFIVTDTPKSQADHATKFNVDLLLPMTIGERLVYVSEQVKDKESAELFFVTILRYYQEASRIAPFNRKIAAFLHDTIAKQALLAKQVSPKFLCDIMTMNLP